MTTKAAGFQPVLDGAPQLASYFRGLWLLLGAFATICAVSFVTQGRTNQGLLAILLSGATGIVLVATRLLGARLIMPAILVTSGAMLALILVIGLVLPMEGEAAVGVLLAVAAGLPYLRGRALAALMVAAWLVGVVVAVAQRALPHLQTPPSGGSVGSGGLAIALSLGLVLYIFWQHSTRLRADLTAQRQAQEEHAQLAAIVENADDAILSTTLDGTVTTWNGGAERLYGYPASEIVGKSIALTFPAADKHEVSARSQRVAAGERIVNLETERIDREGRSLKVSVSLAPLQDDAGRTIGVSAIARDVTVQRTNEEALARSKALLAAAEIIADLGSFEVDLASGQVLWSDHLYRMADLPLGQALDFEAFLAIVHPDDVSRVRATIEDAVSHRADHSYEFRVPRKDGIERVLSCQARVVSDVDGRPVRIFGTAHDITDTRQLEQEFRQAQKMEAVGRLAGGIAHDFNNALTAIIGYGQILAETLDGTPEAEWVGQIEASARHAAGLTRQLLAFSRRQVLKPEVLDLAALVEELVPMLQLLLGGHVELVTTVEPDTGHIRADPGQLQQVILNLASNARDAMPDGGRMTIAVANTTLDAARAATLEVPAGAYVCLTVEDNGQGMDEGAQARIFEPFFTTKEVGKGTGLGLAMVHGVVTQSGGHIGFDSEVGRGTRFRIVLPSIGSTPLAAREETVEPMPRLLTGRVLLVDDEPMVREVTRLTLEANGLTVVEAPDAEHAVAEFERSSDFDLVISDVVMPGSDGGALAQQLRSRGFDVPIIFVSGYPRDSVVARGASEVDYPYLTKPFRASELVALVRKTLRQRAAASVAT